MPRTPDPKRWRFAGYNEGGDPMYERHVGGATAEFSDMSKADLVALAEANGLAKSGNKDDLVARLIDAGVNP